MKIKISHIKVFAAVALVLGVTLASASFTGKNTGGKGDSKFSLKNISKYKKYNYLSLSNYTSLKATYNTSTVKSGNTLYSTNVAAFQKGNTTYLYPYKAKVKMSKFATPKAPTFR